MNINTPILRIQPLQSPWKTQDPFIFCAFHADDFPGGNEEMGPAVPLNGRSIGQDFANKDGWNMYHGSKAPGFPAHPHSGFETVTIVNKGMVDHSDSLGAAGRFGNGDVQWLTAGRGVQHSEMFPLLNPDKNPFELFQIWLNLPKKSKKSEPHYKMLWSEELPVIKVNDKAGKPTEIKLVAGGYGEHKALAPTPDSWAADPNNDVIIWTLKLDANASFSLPTSNVNVNRTLFFYKGDSFKINNKVIESNQLIELDASKETIIANGDSEGYFLLLQGKPINEPVVQHGPFIANDKAGMQEIFRDFQETQFGGWPWPSMEHVHEKSKGRFAIFPDGNEVTK
jgi:redox-sensitive bicupin YhaK (pirin superfamily)